MDYRDTDRTSHCIGGSMSTVDLRGRFWTSPTVTFLAVSMQSYTRLIHDLFSNNEQGFAYDPNDLSTMYQDATGTIPVTAAGQPVGLVLDKSKGLVLGSECFNYVLNNINDGNEALGAYNAATRTLSNSAPSTTNHRPIFAFNVNNWGAGKRYVVKGTILRGHSKIYAIRFGSGVSFTAIPVGADGSFYAVTEAASGILSIIYKLGEVGDIVLGDISVKELSGNHAYQTTSASRPILRQNAATGANYLEFDNTDDYLQVDNAVLPSPLTTLFAVDKSGSYYGVLLSAGVGGYINTTLSSIGFGGSGSIARKTPKDVLTYRFIDNYATMRTSVAEGTENRANTFATAATKYIGLYQPTGISKFNGNIYGIVVIAKNMSTSEEDGFRNLFNKRMGI